MSGNQPLSVQLAILDRLRKVQMVNQALSIAESSYDRIKHSNGLVEATLSQAESMATNLASPLLTTLEKPIHIADNLACQGFDKVHQVLADNPSIETVRKRLQQATDLLQSQSKQLQNIWDQTLEQTRGRVDGFRSQTSEHIHVLVNVTQSFIGSVDNSLNAAENALDRLLPPLKGDEESSDESSIIPLEPGKTSMTDSLRHLVQRMVKFSDKLRRRMWQHADEKWFMAVQKSAENFRENLLKIISMQMSSSMQTVTSATDQKETSKSK